MVLDLKREIWDGDIEQHRSAKAMNVHEIS